MPGGPVLDLDPATYERHWLHGGDRIWTETNCYVDVWIELLHALGLDPVAGCAFTLSTDFEGDQWTFAKFPQEDLRALYGIEVAEMNVWRPVLDHVVEQLEAGRLLTIEVDAWHLPDTAGVSHHLQHTKTTIVPTGVDVAGRRLVYLHNAACFETSGDDFDALFAPVTLPPYIETIRLDRSRAEGPSLDDVLAVTTQHLARRPTDNPMVRFHERMLTDLPWLAAQDIEMFHAYAFGTCRQAGASAELAASFVDWLAARTGAPLQEAATALRSVAETAKALQFTLARAARGRTVDLDGPFAQMAADWERAMDVLVARHG